VSSYFVLSYVIIPNITFCRCISNYPRYVMWSYACAGNREARKRSSKVARTAGVRNAKGEYRILISLVLHFYWDSTSDIFSHWGLRSSQQGW